MDIRALAVASLTFFLLVIGSAGAEDVKIMGLIDTNAAPTARAPRLPDRELSEKPKRMQSHLVRSPSPNAIRRSSKAKTSESWSGYPLKAGQLTYDCCRYPTMHGMPVTGAALEA